MPRDHIGSQENNGSDSEPFPQMLHKHRREITPTAVILPVSGAAFDYDEVPPVTAATLRAQAARIRKLVKTTTSTIIEVGRDLAAVKAHLKHGQFGDWVEAECGFSLRTAENYIRAKEFAEGKSATVALLNPGTVYRLAAKGTPPELVDAVVERAAKGVVVTDREVIAALDEARHQKREKARRQKSALQKSSSKKRREKADALRVTQEERSREEEATRRLVASSIIERLGEDNTWLLVDALARHGVYEMFALLRSVAEGRRRQVDPNCSDPEQLPHGSWGKEVPRLPLRDPETHEVVDVGDAAVGQVATASPPPSDHLADVADVSDVGAGEAAASSAPSDFPDIHDLLNRNAKKEDRQEKHGAARLPGEPGSAEWKAARLLGAQRHRACIDEKTATF